MYPVSGAERASCTGSAPPLTYSAALLLRGQGVNDPHPDALAMRSNTKRTGPPRIRRVSRPSRTSMRDGSGSPRFGSRSPLAQVTRGSRVPVAAADPPLTARITAER